MSLMTFRALAVAVLLAALSAGSAARQARPASAPVPMQVFKTPTCGCCAKWVDHMKAAGFAPEVQDLPNLAVVKSNAGVPANLQSCHTALVGGYVVEGHVPADAVKRMLKEKPKVAGISVPGMPIGSPGMEQGDRRDPYDILTFTKDGRTTVYDKRN
jgi:hypothetical protein